LAEIFYDGFDKYGPQVSNQSRPDLATLMVQGEWTSYGQNSWIVIPGLSRTGYAIHNQGGTEGWVTKTLPGNFTTLIGGLRFSWLSAGADYAPMFKFMDITTTQCSVQLWANGTIGFFQGGYNGTQIQASATSISQNTSHYLEFQIGFGTSASYEFWLDGLPIMTGTHSTITNANSYANVFMLGNDTGRTGLNVVAYDDLYLFDTTGTHNNAPLLVNPRIETRFPNADAQTQWAATATMLGTNTSTTISTDGPGATLWLRKFVSKVNQTITSVSTVSNQTNGAAKYKGAIYADASGVPGTLMSGGVEQVGTTSGVTVTSDLLTPQSLVAGTPYWLGFLTDTGSFLFLNDIQAFSFVVARTYASGLPGTAPAMTGGLPNYMVWGNCVSAPTNWEAVSLNPNGGDYSVITSSTPGQQDWYNFPPLAPSQAFIYSVAAKGNFKRSDTGPRTVDLRIKSGASDSAGSNSGLTAGTAYGWKDSYFPVQPGGADWTLAAANALQAGPKVAT
jgi:hypothetical protein